MDNSTDFEYRGIWWFPNNPDKKFHGILKYSPKEGIELDFEEYEVNLQELAKTFNKKTINRADIILGETINGKRITLQNCIEKNVTMNLPQRKHSFFFVERVFIGYHFKSLDDIKFNRIVASFNNLDGWVNVNGFKIGYSGKKKIKFKVEYKIPKEAKIKINKDLTIKTTFEVGGPSSSMVQKEACIKQKTFIEFGYEKEKKLNEFLHVMKIFQDFLTFATQTTTHPIVMKGYTDKNKTKIKEKTIFNPIEIISPYHISDLVHKQVLPFKMFFTFRDIYPKSKKVIKNWFKTYESMESVIQLYFARFYNPKIYLEYHFLSLIHAIEGYHRAKHKGKYVDNKKYEKTTYKSLVDTIPNDIDRDFKEALKQRLKYGNEFSLRKRLKEIFQELSNLNVKTVVKNQNNFISKVVDTRNYLVHQDKSLKKKSAQGNDLYSLTLRLKFLFDFCLLKEIGFNDDKIKSITSNHISQYNLKDDKK